MSFTTIKLIATFDDEGGNPTLEGAVTATATGALQDTSTGAIVEPEPRQGVVQNGVLTFEGSPGLPVVATDDSTTTPTGVQYTIVEEISGVPLRQYQISVPHDSPGGELDLSTVAP